MRKQIVFWVFLFLYTFSNHSYASSLPYGKWVATGKSKGGIRSALTITAKGELISTFIVMLDFNYSVLHNTIFWKNGEEKEEYTFTLDNNKMELSLPGQHKNLSLRRIYKNAGAKKDSIMGSWSIDNKRGREEYYLFQNDSRGHFIVVMPGEMINQISLDGNKITAKNKGTVMTWEIVEGYLLLKGDKGKSWRYKAIGANTPIRPASHFKKTPAEASD